MKTMSEIALIIFELNTFMLFHHTFCREEGFLVSLHPVFTASSLSDHLQGLKKSKNYEI